MNIDIKFYWKRILARLPFLVVIFVTCAAIGAGVAFTLPATYRASSVLLVESPQIPDELAASTVRTPSREQLEIIEQRLVRRANMIDLANDFGIFEEEERMSPDEVVEEMRARTSIRQTVGRDRATLMTITFEAESAFIAAGVVNELTSLVLSEDAERRQDAAEQTLSFFQQEVERLEAALSQRSADIVIFKEQNSASLPENADFKLDRQSRLQDGLQDAEEEVERLNTQRNRLVQLGTAAFPGGGVRQTPAETELNRAESELAQARMVFSETSPQVKVLEDRVTALQGRVADQVPQENQQDNPARTVLDLQLDEIEEQIERINEEVERANAELTLLQEDISRIPEVAIRLEALEREYQNTQARYNAAANNLALAQTGERIETLAKGQRITVLEQAVPPTEPASPNRPLIAGGGVFLGAGLAAAFFLVAELLNRSIRRPAEIVSALGVQPLATIPYFESSSARLRRRVFIWLFVFVVAVGIPAALWFVHYHFMPLDLLVRKVIERFGL